MRYEAMPNDGLEGFCQRREPLGIDHRDDDHQVPAPRRMTTVAADDAKYAGSALLGEIDRFDNIRADVALAVAAADREHENGVLRADSADLQPPGEDRFPTLIISARGQFGNVVGGAIGFDAAQFAEVVDRVAAVSGAAADAEQKQPTTTIAQRRQFAGHLLDDIHVQRTGNLEHARKELGCMRQRDHPLFCALYGLWPNSSIIAMFSVSSSKAGETRVVSTVR